MKSSAELTYDLGKSDKAAGISPRMANQSYLLGYTGQEWDPRVYIRRCGQALFDKMFDDAEDAL